MTFAYHSIFIYFLISALARRTLISPFRVWISWILLTLTSLPSLPLSGNPNLRPSVIFKGELALAVNSKGVLAGTAVEAERRESTVAKFIVPDWGNKVNSGMCCRTGPPCYKYTGWRADTTTLCRSQLLSSTQGLCLCLQVALSLVVAWKGVQAFAWKG